MILLLASLLVALVAGFLAIDPLFIHGFAPACSDGWAEANGTEPCRADWSEAAPSLAALGAAATVGLACLIALFRTDPA